MIKAFQNVEFFMWRHLLVIMILTICTYIFLNNHTLSIFNSSILIVAFAAFDFAKTKWIKIDVVEKEHIKKFGNFVWRHLLTFGVICLVLSVFIAGRIPGIDGTIIASIFAVFLDCLKFNISFKKSHLVNHQSYEPYKSFQDRNYWNSDIIGTPTYISSSGSTTSFYNRH